MQLITQGKLCELPIIGLLFFVYVTIRLKPLFILFESDK